MVRRAYIETYGCSASRADSEIIAGLLKEADFQLVKNYRESDVNIIVTCTVKSATSQRMIHRIRQLTDIGTPLVVAGCMPKTERKIIEEISSEAGLLGPQSLEKVVDVVESALQGVKLTALEDSRVISKLELPKVRFNPVIEIVEIGSGCLSSCSFCQVKIAKGLLKSYPIEKIVRRIGEAVGNGCREVWLTSTDNGCYGLDIGTNITHLLQKICEIDADFKIRVGMMNPAYVKRFLGELVEAYHDPKVFKFLHLPVQSGSNRILRKMLRSYSVEDFLNIVQEFRRSVSDLTLSTDIIVGFPEEEEDDFQSTLELVRQIKADVVNISRFGARPGTRAALMPQLDSKKIVERSRYLHRIVRSICFKNNLKWIGWRGDIIIDEEVRGAFLGRNSSYKPVIVRSQPSLGEEVKVKIVDATSACLIGIPISTL